jgi:exodeoxyribonuclease VIII
VVKSGPVDEEKTKALDMGTALHCLLLEPDEFDKRFIVAPEFNRRTTAGKEDEAAFLRDVEGMGMTVMTAEQGRKLNIMRNSAMAHPAARWILESSGHCESSMYWNDDETGELCRIRPDKWIPEFNLIADVKKLPTWSDLRATSRNFAITFRTRCIGMAQRKSLVNLTDSYLSPSVKLLTAVVIRYVFLSLIQKMSKPVTACSAET